MNYLDLYLCYTESLFLNHHGPLLDPDDQSGCWSLLHLCGRMNLCLVHALILAIPLNTPYPPYFVGLGADLLGPADVNYFWVVMIHFL